LVYKIEQQDTPKNRSNEMNNPFTTSKYNGKEILSNEVASKNSMDLVIALLAIAVTFGIDRTESAIKETYTKDNSAKIIEIINFAIKATVA